LADDVLTVSIDVHPQVAVLPLSPLSKGAESGFPCSVCTTAFKPYPFLPVKIPFLKAIGWVSLQSRVVMAQPRLVEDLHNRPHKRASKFHSSSS
jgi:hypothetical protein